MTSTAEGDRICSMVLKLVKHLSAIPTAPVQYEPTGAVYEPAVAPYVEQRSDKRRRK